jgi:hypothetical protein
MNMAGDATGKTLSMLSGEETAAVAMTLLSCWIKKYGGHRALYGGRKNAYVTNREPRLRSSLPERSPVSILRKPAANGILKPFRPAARRPRGGSKGTALFTRTVL